MDPIDGVEEPQVSVWRRTAAIVAAILLPAGAGLVVVGRPRRAIGWTAAVLVAVALTRWWPLPAYAASILVSIASIADAALARSPHPGAVEGFQRSAIKLAAFTALVFAARLVEWHQVAEPIEIHTWRMSPSLLEGDRIILERHPAGISRGDIVEYSSEGAQMFEIPGEGIKRVVALGGDRVSWSDHRLFINSLDVSSQGPSCEELGRGCVARIERLPGGVSYIATYRLGDSREPFSCPRRMEPRADGCLVPEGTAFVLGDDRPGIDSKINGPVPLQSISGRAIAIYFSSSYDHVRWSRIGLRLRSP